MQHKIMTGLLVIVLVVLVYCLLYGPLMFLSFIHPGYKSLSTDSMTFLYGTETKLPDYIKSSEVLIQRSSVLYDLPWQQDFVVVLAKDKDDMQRFIPWLKTEGLAGVAFQTGSTLYINQQKIKEKGLSEEEIFKHESTHLLMHQNMPFLVRLQSIMDTFTGKQDLWLTEGIAVHYGGPDYYKNDKDFYKDYKSEKIGIAENGQRIFTNISAGGGGRFGYTLYGYFIRYLINMYGQETFNAFLKDYIANPYNFRETFKSHYKQDIKIVEKTFLDKLQERSSIL